MRAATPILVLNVGAFGLALVSACSSSSSGGGGSPGAVVDSGSSSSSSSSSSSGGVASPLTCMNADDCDGGAICCANLTTMTATCAAGSCAGGDVQLCAASTECLAGGTCTQANVLKGLMVESCQSPAGEAGASSGSASGGEAGVEAGGGPSEAGSVAPEDAASDAPISDGATDAPFAD